VSDRTFDAGGPRRLGRLERTAAELLVICTSVLVMDAAVALYAGSMDLRHALREWPGHLVAAVGVGAGASVMLYTRAKGQTLIRRGALVALLGSVAWLCFTIGVVAIYALVVSRFD
jgi:hypothetical protein